MNRKQVAIFYHHVAGRKEIWIVKEINDTYSITDAELDMMKLNLKYSKTEHGFTVVIERVF